MEWVLDARFTAEQRQRYQQMLAEMWRGNQSSRDAITSMARVHESLPGLDENRRTQMRAEQQRAFLGLLEKAEDESSRWLLGIYRAAHSQAPAPAAGRAATPEPAAGSALLGRWTDGYISSIQYRNSQTGASAPTNGRSFAYEFRPDGTYSFTGLMQSVMYQCTTTMFSNESGTYAVEGDTVSLRPEKNPYRMTNNCAPSSNREAPGKLVARTYRFRIDHSGARPTLELRGDDGSSQKFAASR
jgi:hypothetical protein